nr:unnamed protein product [Callosobruchus chinensis]
MADSIEKLYGILTEAKENVSEHSEEYLKCMEHAKGNDEEKKLAAQIISKFFKHFPHLQEKALAAIFYLCADENYMNSGAFEFGLVMPYLVASKLTKTIAGQQELVNLVAEIAEIDGTFDPLKKMGTMLNVY